MPHVVKQMNQKPKSNYNGPTITIFVGNINEKVSDIIIRQILDVREYAFIYDLL